MTDATNITLPVNHDVRDQPLVSVVVPIFNLEDCVEHCLKSLRSQTYTNLEMVLVDDGSTDASPQILDDFAVSEPRARVFHTVNAGLSAARNYGIACATGELSVYVDGDDIITTDAIQTLVDAYTQNNVDMAIGTSKIITDYDALQTCADHPVRVMDSRDAQITLLYGVPGVSAYDKLATTVFWKEHPFPEGHVFEDLRTTFFNVGDCDMVAIVDGPLYGYMMRAGSTTSSSTISTQRLDDYLMAIEEVQRCFDGNDDPEVQKALICRLAHEYTRVYRHLEAHQDEDPKYKEMLRTIINFERKHCFAVARDKKLGRMPRTRVLLLAAAPKLFTPVYHLAVKAAGKNLA